MCGEGSTHQPQCNVIFPLTRRERDLECGAVANGTRSACDCGSDAVHAA